METAGLLPCRTFDISALWPKYGWGGRIRTSECRIQSPVPYRLATPHRSAALAARFNSSISPGRAQFLTRQLIWWLTWRRTRRHGSGA